MKCEVHIVSSEVFADHAAAEVARILSGEVHGPSGRTIALSGGSTPAILYERLSHPPFVETIQWENLHLFWGDERCVPSDHSESNFRMVQDVLLSKIDCPEENIHRVRTELSPLDAASDYERTLERFFPDPAGSTPVFDLVLLGIGEDGHTASLFPGSEPEWDVDRLVVAVHPTGQSMARVTLTVRVLNSARVIMFLVTGRRKAKIVNEILEGSGPGYPAARIQPRGGRCIWMLDQDAASELQSAGNS